MTGLWQVRGRSSVEAGDRIALDREYVEDWSVAGDLEILCRTPLAVLRISQTH
jgi:undecaprenyl-phosphate galactose phosphotransferase